MADTIWIQVTVTGKQSRIIRWLTEAKYPNNMPRSLDHALKRAQEAYPDRQGYDAEVVQSPEGFKDDVKAGRLS